MHAVNIVQKLSAFSDYWDPKIVGELNGQQVKLVKFKGEFVWHKHDSEDELFYVIQGCFQMHYRDRIETIRENEFIIVPRGVEHKPVATNEVAVMLFQPSTTLNTGNIKNELTKDTLEKI